MSPLSSQLSQAGRVRDDLLEAQLKAALDMIPAHTWYAVPSGTLTFVNERTADFLGLSLDHHLRIGTDMGASWDSHIALLHPDDHDESRRAWSNCLRSGCAGEANFRIRNAQGGYRWFVSRAEPLRASDGTLRWTPCGRGVRTTMSTASSGSTGSTAGFASVDAPGATRRITSMAGKRSRAAKCDRAFCGILRYRGICGGRELAVHHPCYGQGPARVAQRACRS